MRVGIEHLAAHPEAIARLAVWHQAEWSFLHPGGTLATAELARDGYRRPFLVLDLHAGPDATAVLTWLTAHHIQVLNVAGPMESQCPGIQGRAMAFLGEVFDGLAGVA
jgi:hypothetical protein